MSSTSRAWTWTVAASVGVVEALKDQGICRWNSVLRSAQQRAKHNMRSLSHTKKLSSQSSAMSSAKFKDEKAKQSEESLRTVIRAWTWTVAASVGVVEALKDQGICRWNSVLRSAQQHAKHNMGSLSHTKKLSSQSSAMASAKFKDEKTKQSEESLRTVMYLSCWGPN
ncbi:unnamed protein product [Sphenostylis stenocarpa]|uniref:Wound-responsive family protein n=1 Tax=Sphenostylis stenocarpa TaxID=92480 RepID=A0AA86SFB4_9FABA|nr:unnamed protein product [Sphenostylis stenocarpa]